MARTKGSKNKSEVPQTAVDSMVEQTATAGKEASEGKPINVTQPEVATQDIWRYHPDHEPRIFRAGETIPAGWTGPKGIVGKIWRMDAFGKWSKVTEGKPK